MEENLNNVAIFVSKLWKMLNKAEETDIMSWNPSGKSFIIQDQVLFITKLLPLYFKHNNMGSFIRQLNLYDFHKICVDNKNSELEYQHKCFQRDRPDLLKYIKRKLPQYKRLVYAKMDREELVNLSKEITSVKNKQEDTVKQLNLLQQENVSLMKELASLHAKHNSQNRVLKKIIEILIPIFETKGQNKNLVKKQLDPMSKSDFYNWTEPVQNNYKKSVPDVAPNQESLENLKLYNATSSEPVSGFMDPKDLLININQPMVFNEDLEQNVKISKDPINYLDNDLSSLLDSDVLNYNLLVGQSNGLEQEPKV
ncbi:HSF DNA-bind domain containing protein [Asbolus verrucosus]|uniref:HSF DNA-bind domain containing protein n=1 Tax=Asbolus verrucosus TaxID=1661398 RepID=A0A482VGH5_ASBVE|nr:HSF DNA-bind domain containing protein [Asbolus verrucosus]